MLTWVELFSKKSFEKFLQKLSSKINYKCLIDHSLNHFLSFHRLIFEHLNIPINMKESELESAERIFYIHCKLLTFLLIVVIVIIWSRCIWWRGRIWWVNHDWYQNIKRIELRNMFLELEPYLNSKYSKYEEDVLIDPFLRPPICLIIISITAFVAAIIVLVLYDQVGAKMLPYIRLKIDWNREINYII